MSFCHKCLLWYPKNLVLQTIWDGWTTNRRGSNLTSLMGRSSLSNSFYWRSRDSLHSEEWPSIISFWLFCGKTWSRWHSPMQSFVSPKARLSSSDSLAPQILEIGISCSFYVIPKLFRIIHTRGSHGWTSLISLLWFPFFSFRAFHGCRFTTSDLFLSSRSSLACASHIDCAALCMLDWMRCCWARKCSEAALRTYKTNSEYTENHI